MKVCGPVIARATPADVADVARIAGESFSKPWDEGVFHEELGREFASLYVRRPSPAAPFFAPPSAAWRFFNTSSRLPLMICSRSRA